jgi:hypothetical protein
VVSRVRDFEKSRKYYTNKNTYDFVNLSANHLSFTYKIILRILLIAQQRPLELSAHRIYLCERNVQLEAHEECAAKGSLKSNEISNIEWPLLRSRLQLQQEICCNARKCCISNSRACIRPVCPHTDVSAYKMLHHARMAAMTGGAAAS